MTSSRGPTYTVQEDMHLCHIYLDISQNPIIGISQKKDQFWARIETEYHSNGIQKVRPRRSLETRMATILSAVSKLRGCINQIENKNPSGASDQDIVSIYFVDKCIHYIYFLFVLTNFLSSFFYQYVIVNSSEDVIGRGCQIQEGLQIRPCVAYS